MTSRLARLSRMGLRDRVRAWFGSFLVIGAACGADPARPQGVDEDPAEMTAPLPVGVFVPHARTPPLPPVKPVLSPEDDFRCDAVLVAPAETEICQLPVEAVTLEPWTARFYDGDIFVGEEQVDRAAISYLRADFLNIDAQRFRAVWRSALNVSGRARLRLELDAPRAGVDVSLDGWSVSALEDDVRTGIAAGILTGGRYPVEIVYISRWHTVDFAFHATNALELTEAAAAHCLSEPLERARELLFVGVSESTDLYGSLDVELPSVGPVFLLLTSRRGLQWRISNPHGVEVTGIAYAASAPGVAVEADTAIPQFFLPTLPPGWRSWDELRTTSSCARTGNCPVDGTVEHTSCRFAALTGRTPTRVIFGDRMSKARF